MKKIRVNIVIEIESVTALDEILKTGSAYSFRDYKIIEFNVINKENK